MSTPHDRESARRLVESISESHGYLGEDVLGKMEPSLRLKVEEALLRKDELIGDSVITLAKNLYTSKARFVFELLQNADDNRYETASARGAIPFVSFQIYPTKIVVDCNEDGFTDKNLKAICAVGKSSKKGAQGYIGEKGIGFKSVFMAAWKVQVYSGSLSFSFTHREGESGMGMISPQWEDILPELDAPLTRFVLHLHEKGDPDGLKRAREAIHEQFQELQETFLLFTKNLRQIRVGFHDADGQMISSTMYSIDPPRANLATLRRVRNSNGRSEERVKHFHVTKHIATNLAKNENRTYSKSEEASRAFSTSQVVLAFPLSNASIPIVEPQDLFVFLPVRAVGFNFLIQADFVTDASRQDIVRDSLRNLCLLDAIAVAFVKGIIQLSQQSGTRWTWMRFLPDRSANQWGPLWRTLLEKIASLVAKTPVLYGRKGSHPRLLSELFRLPPTYLDNDGAPIFEDGDPEEIVSNSYRAADLSLLGPYGFQTASYEHLMKWLRLDLKSVSHSRMKSRQTPGAWHVQVAKLLQIPFQKQWPNYKKQLLTLDLLPLHDGAWTSTVSGPVYFPEVDGLEIPPDIDLRLIASDAKNPERDALFRFLGVKAATTELVRNKIREKYHLGGRSDVSLVDSKHHLRFFYLSYQASSDLFTSAHSCAKLFIFDTKARLLSSTLTDIYIANDESYGARELFRETSPGPDPGDGAPGFEGAAFIHDEYFVDPPPIPAHKITWVEWLHLKLGIQRFVKCTVRNEGKGQLGDAGMYLQAHRPEKFLGSLFAEYQFFGYFEDAFLDHLKETRILCRGGQTVEFKEAYFPTQQLVSRAQQFVPIGAFFPWLWLDSSLGALETIPRDWKDMLEAVGVGIPSSDLEFALDMFTYSKLHIYENNNSAEERLKLFNLYDHIHSKYREVDDNVKAIAGKRIRDRFENDRSICVPLDDDNDVWDFFYPGDCVWEAPQELKSAFVLSLLYEPVFRDDNARRSLAPLFFKGILGVRAACTWEMYIEELKELRELSDDSDRIAGIYRALDGLRPSIFGINKNNIRDAFAETALIYAPAEDGNTWRLSSECVWSSAARLRGKISLNDDYEDLEDFFVDLLGVKLVDLSMAIDELREVGNAPSSSIETLKGAISTVNSLLSIEDAAPSADDITRLRIFPVKGPNGHVTRASSHTQFFLIDREPFRAAFDGKVKFLDFELEEIRQLRPFLKWAALEDRFLSDCVKEITSFPGEGARLIDNQDRQIWNRAYSLLRIAMHFDSPRTTCQADSQAFYDILRNAEVYAADGISSDLTLSQDGKEHIVEGKRATLHINEGDSGLKVYVPRKRKDQDSLFARLLPERLFEWMMTFPDTQQMFEPYLDKKGIISTMQILSVPRSTMFETLEDLGIAAIDIENLDEEELSESETEETEIPEEVGSESPTDPAVDDEWEDETAMCETPTSSVASPSPHISIITASSAFQGSAQARPRMPSSIPSVFSVQRHSIVSVAHTQPTPSSGTYAALLRTIVNAARNASLPSIGVFDMSLLQGSLPDIDHIIPEDGSDLGVRSQAQIERDCKVGAAGELYVFELLSHLDPQLPGFSRANWPSTMRRYVTVHPDYVDMAPWQGRETSDITYKDSQGCFTEHLIDKGYLDEAWRGKKPQYFIEVKTSTNPCETRFYVSKAQYQRMKDSARRALQYECIYAIFRVYNLGRNNMGLRVYVNPEELRESGVLEFTAESWTVVPGK